MAQLAWAVLPILLPLLGVTWIIGILAVNDDTELFAWIFAIFNSLQVNNIINMCVYVVEQYTISNKPLMMVHVI